MLLAIFAALFLLLKVSGILTFDQVETWLKQAQTLSPFYVGGLVVVLLFADLFVSVPTLTITMLAGFFLGHGLGALAAVSGLYAAGITGYAISRYFGDFILHFLVRNHVQREEAKAAFLKHGFVMIMLSRAVPILPEVTACMAGITRMPFSRFLAAWSVNCIPYVAIAAYAGSVSTLDDPKPAIFAAIGIAGSLWLGWFVFRHAVKRR